jgi:hypothetical protein
MVERHHQHVGSNPSSIVLRPIPLSRDERPNISLGYRMGNSDDNGDVMYPTLNPFASQAVEELLLRHMRIL